MLCWRARKWLSAYIDGELSPARKGRLEEHLRTCAGCAAREKMLRSAWAELPSLPEAAERADLWPGVLRALVERPAPSISEPHGSRLLTAATVAACVVVGLAVGTLFAQQFVRAEATRAAVTQVVADDSFVEAFGDPPLESAAGMGVAATRLRPEGFGGQAASGPAAAKEDAQ